MKRTPTGSPMRSSAKETTARRPVAAQIHIAGPAGRPCVTRRAALRPNSIARPPVRGVGVACSDRSFGVSRGQNDHFERARAMDSAAETKNAIAAPARMFEAVTARESPRARSRGAPPAASSRA